MFVSERNVDGGEKELYMKLIYLVWKYSIYEKIIY